MILIKTDATNFIKSWYGEYIIIWVEISQFIFKGKFNCLIRPTVVTTINLILSFHI